MEMNKYEEALVLLQKAYEEDRWGGTNKKLIERVFPIIVELEKALTWKDSAGREILPIPAKEMYKQPKRWRATGNHYSGDFGEKQFVYVTACTSETCACRFHDPIELGIEF